MVAGSLKKKKKEKKKEKEKRKKTIKLKYSRMAVERGKETHYRHEAVTKHDTELYSDRMP